MKKGITLFIIFIALLSSACSDWLDVQPSDRVSEETNFSDVAGFKQALNGIYIEMNASGLYGRSLTCEFIEVLAQRYAVGNDNKDNQEVMKFEYEGAYVKGRLTSVWSSAYALIANVNLILKNCEEHRSVLPDEYYHLVKGEALALRAYLHFDIFRLFGPVYSLKPESVPLPYYKEQSFDVVSPSKGSEFMDFVVADLLAAEKELEDDPVIKSGVRGNGKDVFLQYRNLRLNYYAVQALLARVYLYINDTGNAFDYASKVIAVQEAKFPWVDPTKLNNSNTMDRIFSTEVLFALQNLERGQLFRDLFDGQNLKMQTLLAPQEDIAKDVVFEGIISDYRYNTSLNRSVEFSGKRYCVLNKYQGSDSLYHQMIPLLRISEMYLIAAETGKADKKEYLNKLRNHRGLRAIEKETDVETELGKEWLREFYAEGQLFFYYKRKNMETIQSATSADGKVSMTSENYVLPIPDGESKYN